NAARSASGDVGPDWCEQVTSSGGEREKARWKGSRKVVEKWSLFRLAKRSQTSRNRWPGRWLGTRRSGQRRALFLYLRFVAGALWTCGRRTQCVRPTNQAKCRPDGQLSREVRVIAQLKM